MTLVPAQYPTSVWTGLSDNLDRVTLHDDIPPNSCDWDQIVSEVIATQTHIDTLEGLLRAELLGVQNEASPAGTSGALKRYAVEVAATAEEATAIVIALAIPAGARVLGVQLRVDVALTSGDEGSTWDAAFSGGLSTSIATSQSFDINTKVNLLLDANAASVITTDETDITVACDSGAKTFAAGGVIRAVVYYEALDAMDDVAEE